MVAISGECTRDMGICILAGSTSRGGISDMPRPGSWETSISKEGEAEGKEVSKPCYVGGLRPTPKHKGTTLPPKFGRPFQRTTDVGPEPVKHG